MKTNKYTRINRKVAPPVLIVQAGGLFMGEKR